MAAVAADAATQFAVHLDHIEDPELLRAGADAGVSSAMFDASRLSYRDNVAATKAAADWAHSRGLFVEAELGEVGGKDGVHTPGARTSPPEAVAFVAATGVDALAVAVGSSHAMSARAAELDLDLIARLRAALPVPLVLHGSSGVAEGTCAKRSVRASPRSTSARCSTSLTPRPCGLTSPPIKSGGRPSAISGPRPRRRRACCGRYPLRPRAASLTAVRSARTQAFVSSSSSSAVSAPRISVPPGSGGTRVART